MQNQQREGSQYGINELADDFGMRPFLLKSLKVHNQKGQKKEEEKAKFYFEPDHSIEYQFNKLKEFCQNYNERKLQVKGFKGTFKIENWIYVETELRSIGGLKAIEFVDTQLDKVHLVILQRWIQWVQPKNLIIEFQQNELDDDDCSDFLYFLFGRSIDVESIYIISNPGVYKGTLLKQFKEYLQKKFDQNSIQYYKLIKNKQAHSVAIIRILRNKDDDFVLKKLKKAEAKINKSHYYKLELRNCFTDTNWKGFQDLIQKTYNEDNLEQLNQLDISNNFLGSQNAFNNMCISISSAKGLSVLKLANQPLIHNSETIQLLMGNRYDNLKLKELDISYNSEMSEKAFKLLSDNIFQFCNIINFEESLPQQYSTLFKLLAMTDSFGDKLNENKLLYIKKKQYRKDHLQILDLSSVDSYNRHDIVEQLLNNTVFNEFSNIKKLYVQNVDPGRCEAYIQAKQKFLVYMKKKQNDDLFFQNYKHPLKHIVYPQQSYSMEIQIKKEFFLEYLFTEKGSIIEIQSIEILKSTFEQTNRAEGLKAACITIIARTINDFNIKYSIKKVSMIDTGFHIDFNTIKCFLCLPSVQLNEFTYINNSMTLTWNNWYEEMKQFCSELNVDEFHSLQILNLQQLQNITIEINQFIELFIFNPKIQLKELTLNNIQTNNEDENNKALKKVVVNSGKASLQKLSFGQFQDGIGEDIIFEQVIFNTKVNLQNLSLINLNLLLHLELIERLSQNTSIENPLKFLTSLEIDKIDMDTKEDWKRIINIFIIKQRLTLKSLKIKQSILNSQFSQALNQLLLPFEQERFIKMKSTKEPNGIVLDVNDKSLISQFQNDNQILPFFLTDLSFENCSIQDDVLSGFLIICELKSLSIINCQDFTIGIKKTMDMIKSLQLDQYYTFTIKSLSCEGTILNDAYSFKSLIEGIALNLNRQQLEILNLNGCNLNDEMIQILSKQLQIIKEEQKFYHRVFLLRDLNLSNNNQIQINTWQLLWDALLNQNILEKKQEILEQKTVVALNSIKLPNNFQTNRDNLIEETQKLIDITQLLLKEKILYNYQKFTPQFPKQIKSLMLKMDYPNVYDTKLQFEYYRLIVGFIIHPESELEILELDSLNLIIFIKASLEAYEFSKIYLQALKQSKQYKQEHKCLIKSIKLTNLTDNDAESTKKFIQMFLCSKHIELKKFYVSGCTEPILHLILENMNRRENYQLEELHLPDLEETLQYEDTINYVQWIIFGQKMPIKILNSSPILADINQEIFDQFSLSQIRLKSLSLSFIQRNIKQYSIILFRLILHGLEELIIDQMDATQLIEETFNRINNFDNLMLRQVIFKGDLKFNKKLFDKFFILFKKLELFKVEKLLIEDQQDFYDICYCVDVQQSKNLKFDLKEIKCNSPKDFFNQFIFNPNIGIKEIVFQDLNLLKNQLQIKDLGQTIRYINLNMKQTSQSIEQPDINALDVIGKMLIYNEQSNLEELILHQCNLKISGIFALCKNSRYLREKISMEGREKTAQLKLKRITLYYSLYIGEDGIQQYFKDLLYFEYINIERFELISINGNDQIINDLCLAASMWLQFQKDHYRLYQTQYPIKYLDIGRNELIKTKQAWINFLKTFVFTDNTPQLTTLNIYGMDLNDLKIKYIVEEALHFFTNKSSNYKYNIKKINISDNPALSHKGWYNLFKNFFFHPKVDLEELNMTYTMIDNQKKLDLIAEVIRERAIASPNQKVPLHTFLCYNISLKDQIADYLSNQPQNYLISQDLPVETEYENSLNLGFFDGYPESFGDILQMFQRILKLRQNVVYQQDWTVTRSKYSHYHLNMCDHYLNILNMHYNTKGNNQIDIYISLLSLDNFANFFDYKTEYPGSPYPYNILFSQRTFDYFKEKNCNIFKIKIIQTEFAELEQINQFQILKLWHNIKHHSTSIDQIQIEYELNDDLIEEMFQQGYNEYEIISLIRIIPPSKIRIQNSLSIQAIKGIYSILYDTYYFKYAIISYSFDNFLNIGIGYSMREVFYNYNAIGTISKFIKIVFYKFFNFFVKPTKKYIFNEEVKQLNNYLSQQQYYFFIIVITNILFFVITLAGPYLFTYKLIDTDNSQLTKPYLCVNGTSKQASYLYYAFAVLSLITESILYYKVAQIVPNHAERIIIQKIEFEEQQDNQHQQQQLLEIQSNKILPASEEEAIMLKKKQQALQIQVQEKSISKKITSFSGKLTQAITTQAEEFTQSKFGIYLSYFMTLLSSQLFKFDLYNGVVFILNAFNCDEFSVFILALITTVLSQGIYILQFIYLVSSRLTQNQKTAKLLSCKFINDFYAISFLGRNAALSTILDSSSPFNVIIIPNTRIIRYLFPQHAGKAMSNLVKSYFFQFIFEDLPQTLLQMYFVVSQALKRSSNLQVQVYISIFTAIFTALSSFYKFLSIRPSNLLQRDFDEMSVRLSNNYDEQIQNCLRQEQIQIQTFIELYNTPDHELLPAELSEEERQNLLN